MTTSCSFDLSSLKVMKSMPLIWLSWNVGLCGRPALSVVGCRLVPWQDQCTKTWFASDTPTCRGSTATGAAVGSCLVSTVWRMAAKCRICVSAHTVKAQRKQQCFRSGTEQTRLDTYLRSINLQAVSTSQQPGLSDAVKPHAAAPGPRGP